MGLFSRRRPPAAGQAASADAERIAPEFAEAHFALGNALREKNLLDEAAASYERAVACRPELAEGWYNLGNTQWQLGRLDAAIASFTKAAAIRPAFAEAHHNLGNVLVVTGRFTDALAAQQRAIALAPGLADAWLGLAHALAGRVFRGSVVIRVQRDRRRGGEMRENGLEENRDGVLAQIAGHDAYPQLTFRIADVAMLGRRSDRVELRAKPAMLGEEIVCGQARIVARAEEQSGPRVGEIGA